MLGFISAVFSINHWNAKRETTSRFFSLIPCREKPAYC